MAGANGPRLFVRAHLAAGMSVELDRGQANYLVNVLRLQPGDPALVFNGEDGEWRAVLTMEGKRLHGLEVERQTRPQTAKPTLRYLFAPLKQGRLDYMVQKAVEMGAGRLTPVITRYTEMRRVNVERMEANAIEAAEQCGILSLPAIDAPVELDTVLDGWSAGEPRRLVYCDEDTDGRDPVAVLRGLIAPAFGLLVGPEGGFSPEERARLRTLPFVTPIALGPRILRADTAAVAAMALVQAVVGDWHGAGPRHG